MINEETGEIMREKSSLFPKLARVMGQVSRIPKEGRFRGKMEYDFVRASDLCDAIRPLLAAEGVGLLYSVESVDFPVLPAGGRAATERDGQRCIVTVGITLGDESGETLHAQAIGESIDWGDKGLNKAQTAAVKYWLLKTFLVATGEGDEYAPEEPPSRSVKVRPTTPVHTFSEGERQKLALAQPLLNLTQQEFIQALLDGVQSVTERQAKQILATVQKALDAEVPF